MFWRVNGYPNDFWGWGGEDDELSTRLQEGHVKTVRPTPDTFGAVTDLEEEAAAATADYIRASTKLADGGLEALRNMERRELLASHASSWEHNGVSNVTYTVVSSSSSRDTSTTSSPSTGLGLGLASAGSKVAEIRRVVVAI